MSRNSGASGVSSPNSENATGLAEASITGSSERARASCKKGAPGMKAATSAPIAGSSSSACAVRPKMSSCEMPMVVMSSGLSMAA